jgi:hypothetical protein
MHKKPFGHDGASAPAMTRRHRRLRTASALALAGVLAGGGAAAQTATKATTSPKPHPVVGWIENALIDPGGLLIRAKLDTGARTSSLNAPDYKIFDRDGQPWVRFTVTNREGESVSFERRIARSARIKRIMGPPQSRPVVVLTVCVGTVRGETEVNLVNREGFNYQMLIGRRFLARRLAVDPSVTLTSHPMCGKAG